jgi:membrane protein
MMAREVMLFAGGASFFALLALFPAVLVGVSVYGLLFSADDALNQLSSLQVAEVLPPTAYGFLQSQLSQIAGAPRLSLGLQSTIAVVILLFAAGRGAKALIAGLNQIAGRGDLRNVLHFNLLAMALVLAGGGLLIASNLIILAVPNLVRPALDWLGAEGIDIRFVFNEWTTATIAMIVALMLLYRYLMQRAGETSWSASFISASVATGLWLAISNGFTFYVSTIVNPSAYGSLGALIVFLLWVYWASYAVFFGGALAVEIDKLRGETAPP